MNVIRLGLLVAAFVLAVIAAAGVPSGRVSLLAASLACFELSELVGQVL